MIIAIYIFFPTLKKNVYEKIFGVVSFLLVALIGYSSINKYNDPETEEYMRNNFV